MQSFDMYVADEFGSSIALLNEDFTQLKLRIDSGYKCDYTFVNIAFDLDDNVVLADRVVTVTYYDSRGENVSAFANWGAVNEALAMFFPDWTFDNRTRINNEVRSLTL